MQENPENKFYFKGNAYAGQNYVPSSALKNRKKQIYLVELPQGDSFFGGSRKKQFASLHHHSEIKQIKLFQEQQKSRFHHGTYEVSDIEGANSNSLLSQAVKNRMKGISRQNSRQVNRLPKIIDSKLNNQISSRQYQLINNSDEIPQNYLHANYHFRQKRTVTQPTQMLVNNTRQYRDSYRQQKYIADSTQTEGSLKEIERLLFKHQDNILKSKQQYFEDKNMQSHKISQPSYYNPNKVSKDIKYQYQQQVIRDEVDRNQAATQIDRPKEHYSKKNKHSAPEIKNLWHGDHHKLLFAQKDIRRLNPTYLSSENYLNSAQFLPYIPKLS